MKRPQPPPIRQQQQNPQNRLTRAQHGVRQPQRPNFKSKVQIQTRGKTVVRRKDEVHANTVHLKTYQGVLQMLIIFSLCLGLATILSVPVPSYFLEHIREAFEIAYYVGAVFSITLEFFILVLYVCDVKMMKKAKTFLAVKDGILAAGFFVLGVFTAYEDQSHREEGRFNEVLYIQYFNKGLMTLAAISAFLVSILYILHLLILFFKKYVKRKIREIKTRSKIIKFK